MPRVKLFDEKEVLEKATCLFWKKGYYDTSIQDLVSYLGINRASLYDTFGGKKSLFEKSFVNYCSRNWGAQREFLATFDDVRTGFKVLFDNAIQESEMDAERRGCFAVNCTVELIPNDVEFSSLVAKNREEIEKNFLNYLKSGIDKGQISKDKNVDVIASLFFTFISGLKVVTKIDFNKEVHTDSVAALLSVLD